MLTSMPLDNENANKYIQAVIPRKDITSPFQIDISTNPNNNRVLYNYEGDVFHRYQGNYLINKNGIMKNENGVIKPTGMENIYVYNSGIETFTNTTSNMLTYFSDTRLIDVPHLVKDIVLMNEDSEPRFKVTLEITNGKLNAIHAFEKLAVVVEGNNSQYTYTDSEYMLIGSYNGGILSEVPIYIKDLEVIIQFTHHTSITEKYYVIEEISISRTIYDCTEYLHIKPTRTNGYTSKVMQRKVFTMKYSNKPGDFIVTSTPLVDSTFGLMYSTNIYKYHPRIEYTQKNFVSPKYANTDGTYITVINKPNQNIITSNVLIRNNYDHSNQSVDNNIAPRILCTKEHIIESVNKNYMLIGNMEKVGTLNDIAINSEKVYLVPTTARMYISLEFT